VLLRGLLLLRPVVPLPLLWPVALSLLLRPVVPLLLPRVAPLLLLRIALLLPQVASLLLPLLSWGRGLHHRCRIHMRLPGWWAAEWTAGWLVAEG
jgi:hypothetical protein